MTKIIITESQLVLLVKEQQNRPSIKELMNDEKTRDLIKRVESVAPHIKTQFINILLRKGYDEALDFYQMYDPVYQKQLQQQQKKDKREKNKKRRIESGRQILLTKRTIDDLINKHFLTSEVRQIIKAFSVPQPVTYNASYKPSIHLNNIIQKYTLSDRLPIKKYIDDDELYDIYKNKSQSFATALMMKSHRDTIPPDTQQKYDTINKNLSLQHSVNDIVNDMSNMEKRARVNRKIKKMGFDDFDDIMEDTYAGFEFYFVIDTSGRFGAIKSNIILYWTFSWAQHWIIHINQRTQFTLDNFTLDTTDEEIRNGHKQKLIEHLEELKTKFLDKAREIGISIENFMIDYQ